MEDGKNLDQLIDYGLVKMTLFHGISCTEGNGRRKRKRNKEMNVYT
jgi:hypothetical protein